ncbi:MAG TPA: protein-disulfide reductase DsbD [Thiobacillaceae bacterium]|nr:protein-disulfide reductase DsbD [Thiobacillaceae bacterium]HNU63788.1 protein-disulfide reductase DsbD [Thiobacillaceae bacterium]
MYKHLLRRCIFLLLCVLNLIPAASLAEEELLEPEKAFQFSAREIEPGRIEARFQIAKGYYLYHDKFGFATDAQAKLGTPELPQGKVKDDAFFGRVETHRGDLRILIPVTGGGATPYTLKADFQGCADLGVCYPPQQASALIRPVAASAKSAAPVAAAATAATPATQPAPQRQSSEVLAGLKNLASTFGMEEEPELLSPEEAFQLSVFPRQGGGLEARFNVAPDYYLYRDKIRFSVVAPAGARVTELDLAKADEKDDPNFGKTFVYHKPFAVGIDLAGLPADARYVRLSATYQGCNEPRGICYPPQDVELEVDLTATPVVATGRPDQAASPVATDTSEAGRITQMLHGRSFWVVIVSFFGFGLLLSLTPCVFPMIPILSGIIVGGGSGVTKARGFSLSLAYVLGMATTYAIIGIFAGLSGTLISNALQNPWALGAGAAIFVALALSMFGFYDLQMPGFLQSRLTETSNRIKGGHLGGVFIMGVLSALIVGPCVAAPLAGALLYISQTGDVVLGGVSLFFLALGMGVPLLALGLSAGALLPRAGAWMEAVKQFFGVTLLALAIWLISPLLSSVTNMLLWAALLIISAMYLHALEPLAVNAKGFARFWKGVGIVILVTGVSLLLGALGGSRDSLQPLAVFQGGAGSTVTTTSKLTFQRVKDLEELDAAVASARGKPVMLDFYADWCVSCIEMERFTFTDARVQERLRDVVLLQADVTGNTADDKALLARFKLFGPPGIIFFDAEGREKPYRVIGYEKADQFLASIDKALQ